MLGVGLQEASPLPTRTRVTPGTRARTQAIQASPPALGLHGVVKTTCCSWPCADVADAQESVNRAAAAPLGGLQAAPTSNTCAPRSSQSSLQDVRVRATSSSTTAVSANQRRIAETHTHTPRVHAVPHLASHGVARPLSHAYTHVPSPHISSLRAVLGA